MLETFWFFVALLLCGVILRVARFVLVVDRCMYGTPGMKKLKGECK